MIKMEDELRKIGLVVVVIASLVAASVIPLAMADGEAKVTCTVTAVGIKSVSISTATIAYGTVTTGENKTSALINATNDGPAPEDLLIYGDDAHQIDGEETWLLCDTAGDNKYRHDFSNDTAWYCLNSTAKTLARGVPIGGNVSFRLRLYAPTTISSPGTYETNVTVIAA